MPEPEVGDVFTIPIDENRVGFGQVILDFEYEHHYYFRVFGEAYPRDECPSAADAVNGKLEFLALSMDALLYHERWKVVGRAPVPSESLPWPAYKEENAPGVFVLVDHTAQRRKSVEPVHAERFPYLTVHAPIILQNALRAVHGVHEHLLAYDELRPPPPELTSSHVFGPSER